MQRKADETGWLCLQYLARHNKPRLLAFFHFSDPDTAGHKYGMDSEEYRQAASQCDKWLGEILSKLKEMNLAENTLIYITTDHGFDKHVPNAKSHNCAPDCWLVTNDLAISRNGEIADIAATIIHRFDIEVGQRDPPLAGEPLISH